MKKWDYFVALLAVLLTLASKPLIGEIPEEQLSRVKSSAVFIKANSLAGEQSGSGFLFAKDEDRGLIVTNAHVVYGERGRAGIIQCLFFSGTDREFAVVADLVRLDVDRDLALLEVRDERLPDTIELANLSHARETMTVFSVGFPFGTSLGVGRANPAVTLAKGTLSAIRRDESNNVAVLQVHDAINVGNSGGPIVDAAGKLVGIAFAVVPGTHIGFAIPAVGLKDMTRGRIEYSTIVPESIDSQLATLKVNAFFVDPLREYSSLSLLFRGVAENPDADLQDDDGQWLALQEATAIKMALEDKSATCRIEINAAQESEYIMQYTFTRRVDGLVGYSEPVYFELDFKSKQLLVGNERSSIRKAQLQPIAPPSEVKRFPVIDFSWKPTPTELVHVPNDADLASRVERDEMGRLFDLVVSPGMHPDLGQDVLQIASCPTGSVLYVIRHDDSAVYVVDPMTWETKAEISVPESPTSIWADESRIAVSCGNSKVVTLIDAKERSVIASTRMIRELFSYAPDTIVGRAPDGSIMSLWTNGLWRNEKALVHSSEDGTGRVMIKDAPLHWVTWLLDGTGVIGQNNFDNSPAGTLDLAYPQGPKGIAELHNNRIFGSAGLHSDTGKVSFTRDRSSLILPRYRVDPEDRRLSNATATFRKARDRRSRGRRLPWTYLLSPSLDSIKGDFPGSVVTEIPQENVYVTLGVVDGSIPVCYYVSTTDLQVIREVRLEFPETAPKKEITPKSDAVFVPGHELLLVPENQSGYTVFRCGPIKESLAGRIRPINAPPSTIDSGGEFQFTPELKLGVELSGYRLKRAPQGMEIDQKTGTIVWRPSTQHVGKWPVTILAKIGDEEVTLASWTLQVR